MSESLSDPLPDAPSDGQRARPRPRSFRLLEVLIAMSIMVTLAGMLVPYTVRIGERTKLANATAELEIIASSLSSYAGDIHRRALEADATPGADNADNAAGTGGAEEPHTWWLRGPGELPAGCSIQLSEQTDPTDHRTLPGSVARARQSPMLLGLQPDPWGSSYLIRLEDLGQGTSGSRVLSAGPDRTLHTADDLQHTVD